MAGLSTVLDILLYALIFMIIIYGIWFINDTVDDAARKPLDRYINDSIVGGGVNVRFLKNWRVFAVGETATVSRDTDTESLVIFKGETIITLTKTSDILSWYSSEGEMWETIRLTV